MKLRRTLRRFGGERKGLAALEFAILAPMMIFVLFGSIELLDLLDTNQRVENAAASLADVVARDTEVSDDEVTGFWAALDMLMFPDTSTNVNIRITSVSVQTTSQATVVWSEAHGNMAPRQANSTITLPSGMMTPGTSIIYAEAQMDYQGPLGLLLSGPLSLRHDAYRRSRLVDPIPRV